jgi:polar amino acid transport system substrate-binding protein
MSTSIKVLAESAKPKSLIFAVQPHDALNIRNEKHNNNIVIKLAKRLNLNIEIYECPWARCVKAIENGDADIIDDLFFSSDRAVYSYFLKPSFETQSSGYRFYADNTKTKLIQNWDDLLGLRIGFLRGYKHFPTFDESTELNKVDIINVDVVVNMMLKDRIDIFISPPSFNEKSFDEIDIQNKMTKQPFSHIEPTPLFIALSKKSPWISHKKAFEISLNEILYKNAIETE